MTGKAGGRVLVVDDTEMNRDMLSRRLRRMGYVVATEDGGAAALARIAKEPFDLVILDVMMPDVDGMAVLRSVRQRFSPNELPVLMATAKDSSDDVVAALEAGANDYVTKPLDFPVVMARVRTQLALKDSHDQLQSAHRRMKEDLDAAARIQCALIPDKFPFGDRLKIACEFRPCTELGGDIFDVVPLNDRYVVLYIVDVSGHGVPAALMSVTVSRLLSHSASESLLRHRPELISPSEVASILNRSFPMDGAGQYFTFICALLDLETRQLTFSSAGHPGPVHICRNGECRQLLQESFAIGWFPQAEFENRTLTMNSGDRLYFFSDGVIEEASPAGELFQIERLSATLHSLAGLPLRESLDELLLELQTWNGGRTFADDVSVVSLEIE